VLAAQALSLRRSNLLTAASQGDFTSFELLPHFFAGIAVDDLHARLLFALGADVTPHSASPEWMLALPVWRGVVVSILWVDILNGLLIRLFSPEARCPLWVENGHSSL
jgi:hypothetical protein